MYNAKSLLTALILCGIMYSSKEKRGIYLMKMKTITTNRLIYFVETSCDIYPIATEDLDLAVEFIVKAINEIGDYNSADPDYIKSDILESLANDEKSTFFIAYDDDDHMESVKISFLRLVERA